MSPVREVGLVAAREFKRNVKSAKGIALLAICLMMGGAATLANSMVDKFARSQGRAPSPEEIRAFTELGITKAYGDEDLGKFLAGAPSILLGMFFFTIWSGPLIIALMGFDSVSGELQHRAVRFLSVRLRRESIYVGKVAGLFATVALVGFATNVTIWCVAAGRGDASLSACLSWGLRFWLMSLPITLAWCSIAAFAGSLLRTPVLSLMVIFVTFFGLWMFNFVSHFGDEGIHTYFRYVYPNTFDGFLLSPRASRSLIGLASCAGFVLATSSAGAWYFAKRDV
jgi:ABC-type transport system involved in multi-copper enzyme maturation permease subunit